MKISNRTISALQKLITGDPVADGASPLVPYRGGPKLVQFFNDFGFDDVYDGSGFPPRWTFVESKLRSLNGTPRLKEVILAALHPGEFIATEFQHCDAVDYLNQFLGTDGFKVVVAGNNLQLTGNAEPAVVMEADLDQTPQALNDFIGEQLLKCDAKLKAEDYDGAITNARSLVEAVLLQIENRLVEDPMSYDGKLPKLNNRVSKLLNLDPSRKDISESLRQVLSGLTSVVNGIAPLRNTLSDSHAQSYRPQRHHAKLAVNSAKTLSDFLFDTFEYQKAKGFIKEVPGEG